MTAKDTGTHDITSIAVQVRAEGDVDEDALSYVRNKVDAALSRPGLPEVTGVVRIARAAAHHVERPWSARAEIHVGSMLVVVHAEEASAGELADRLQDRLRGQIETALHRKDAARRTATPPPWRGGRTDGKRH
ncbi:hypothetical protein [Streptomyces sp. NK08204]|uniref:hypothetical protein n=1 Tax=Streptomyces sp. NK08204 TaxID=2873260 RepID=UPI001CEDA2C3|nr:hypothetical protein [Streptomyces sp. NK08204]